MAILQVRSMDDNLYAALGRRADIENRSISQEVISIIKKYLSTPQSISGSTDDEVMGLAGSWNDTRSADKIADDIRTDRSTKRFKGEF